MTTSQEVLRQRFYVYSISDLTNLLINIVCNLHRSQSSSLPNIQKSSPISLSILGQNVSLSTLLQY
jgi:hypothetical protein